MGELGPQQKPSELLAHLVELAPADELDSKYLIFLFIQRLPKILRMQLGDDLDLDLRDISERADRLWSIHAHDMASSVAAVAAAEPADEESGQPVRAVTAVAADQPPARPRFIALPPGSLGSVILDEFPEVANASKVLPPSSHGVEHFISTKGPPIASKFRRLDAEKLQAAKAEFEQLEREGIVQRSTSPWASPLHMVMKKDGSWRPCGDFRRLNLVTEPDTYPLPNMLDFSARVAGCKVFSKIDLRKGYYQIPMHPADIRKTAICTPFGLFEFRRMPFGLRNAGNTFQRMMDRILAGLSFVFCYLDDIIIASRDEEEHLEHLREVFSRLRPLGHPLGCLERCPVGGGLSPNRRLSCTDGRTPTSSASCRRPDPTSPLYGRATTAYCPIL